MLNISIKTIKNSDQRYPTLGDYYQDGSEFKILISDLHNEDYEFLIAIHELTESYLCKKAKIKETNITEFDRRFENLREQVPHLIGLQEPGNMVSAPYFEQHQIATDIEKQLAKYLNIDWKDYNDYLDQFDIKNE